MKKKEESGSKTTSENCSDEYDPEVRRKEKEESRKKDAEALASGEKTAEQLWKENSMFYGMKFRIVFEKSSNRKRREKL